MQSGSFQQAGEMKDSERVFNARAKTFNPEKKSAFDKAVKRAVFPISWLFHITGICCCEYTEACKKQGLKGMILTIMKYLFRLISYYCLVYWFTLTLMSKEKKFAAVKFLVFLSVILAHASVNQNHIGPILRKLSKISSALNHFPSMVKTQIFVVSYCLFSVSALIFGTSLTIYSEKFMNTTAGTSLDKYLSFSYVSEETSVCIHDVHIMLHVVLQVLILTPIISLYTYICRYIKMLFSEITAQLRAASGVKDITHLCLQYDECADLIFNLDKHFCFAMFILVFYDLMSIFWVGVETIFLMPSGSDTRPSGIALMFYMVQLFIVIFPATNAMLAGDLIRDELSRLLGQISPGKKVLKITAENSIELQYSFTLWNMYPIDRALIFTCFGSLATYGLLISNLAVS